jgi:hypothetical protein
MQLGDASKNLNTLRDPTSGSLVRCIAVPAVIDV